jgi:hypothetical protein
MPGSPIRGRRAVERWLDDDPGVEEARRVGAEEERAKRGNGAELPAEGVLLNDFYAYMPMHSYIFAPSREMWPAASVNSRIPPVRTGTEEIKASAWLDRHKPVEQLTWAPGFPEIIEDRLIGGGEWVDRQGVRCFNLYRPPVIRGGDPTKAARWLEHVRLVYPDDADHIVKWLAHRVQRPGDKVNHALLLGGEQGIGKDSLLAPAKRAVGPWNFEDVTPKQALGRFNGFLKSVILRINEARDLGDFDRFAFYDHLKAITASPPEVLRVDEKNLREYNIINCCGVIITTNHKKDGIFLPAGDRRHYVAWSELPENPFPPDYWTELHTWYEQGGFEHVATYLAQLPLADFNPKAPPLKTEAFFAIAQAGLAPETSELADALDALGRPAAVTITDLASCTTAAFYEWLADRRNARIVPHRFEEAGYTTVRNGGAKDGLWVVNGRRRAVYVSTDLPPNARPAAAAERALNR